MLAGQTWRLHAELRAAERAACARALADLGALVRTEPDAACDHVLARVDDGAARDDSARSPLWLFTAHALRSHAGLPPPPAELRALYRPLAGATGVPALRAARIAVSRALGAGARAYARDVIRALGATLVRPERGEEATHVVVADAELRAGGAPAQPSSAARVSIGWLDGCVRAWAALPLPSAAAPPAARGAAPAEAMDGGAAAAAPAPAGAAARAAERKRARDAAGGTDDAGRPRARRPGATSPAAPAAAPRAEAEAAPAAAPCAPCAPGARGAAPAPAGAEATDDAGAAAAGTAAATPAPEAPPAQAAEGRGSEARSGPPTPRAEPRSAEVARARAAAPVVRLALSGFKERERQALEAAARALGALIVGDGGGDDADHAHAPPTHLLVGALKRSHKLLLALAAGAHVLRAPFVAESARAGTWVDEGAHALAPLGTAAAAEAALAAGGAAVERVVPLGKGALWLGAPEWHRAHRSARGAGPLAGTAALVLPGTQPAPEALARLLGAAGASARAHTGAAGSLPDVARAALAEGCAGRAARALLLVRADDAGDDQDTEARAAADAAAADAGARVLAVQCAEVLRALCEPLSSQLLASVARLAALDASYQSA